MYYKKIESILQDLESKNIEIAGGSAVGMVLSIVNSLIKYIANLTVDKKKYEDVQEQVKVVLNKAELLKQQSLQIIDKDKEILEEILNKYKVRKEDEKAYQDVCKKSTEFCMKVVIIAINTLKLAEEISNVGNKMLESDFRICKYYAFASVQSALENVYINVKSVNDKAYNDKILNECKNLLSEAENIIE